MRELKPTCVAPDMFEVESIRKDKKGVITKNIYQVDLRGESCNCKSFYYRKKPCEHIKSVIQILRSQDKIVKYNKEDKTHTVVE